MAKPTGQVIREDDKRKLPRVYFTDAEFDELRIAAGVIFQGSITAGITVNDLLNAFCLRAARKVTIKDVDGLGEN